MGSAMLINRNNFSHLDVISAPASRHEDYAVYGYIYTPLHPVPAPPLSHRFPCQHRSASRTPRYKSTNYLDDPSFPRRYLG